MSTTNFKVEELNLSTIMLNNESATKYNGRHNKHIKLQGRCFLLEACALRHNKRTAGQSHITLFVVTFKERSARHILKLHCWLCLLFLTISYILNVL